MRASRRSDDAPAWGTLRAASAASLRAQMSASRPRRRWPSIHHPRPWSRRPWLRPSPRRWHPVHGGSGSTPAPAIERRRRLLAEAKAGASQPGRRAVGLRRARRTEPGLQLFAYAIGAAGQAGDVVAHMDDARRPRLEREQGVEAGHTVGLGGRHAQSAADLVERRLADPADPRLDGVERRQQEVAPIARRMPAPGAVAIETWLPRTGDRLDRGTLDGRGQRADDVEIHRRRV